LAELLRLIISAKHKTFRNHLNASIIVEGMEKAWEELKRIEAQAEQIRTEAQEKAKEIISLAQQEAKKLVSDSKNYAQNEADQLYANTIEEANRNRDQQLEASKATAEKLSVEAEERMDKASSTVVKAVIGESES
jgi:V/A-type H+-transporting ATPase subunit G/H